MPKKGKRKLNTSKSDVLPPIKSPRLVCDLPLPEIPKAVGKLLSCGQGDMGQLGLGDAEMEKKRPALVADVKNVADICAGGMHSLYLTADGKIFSFGCNDEGALGRDTSEEGSEFTPMSIDLPEKAVMISAGDSHSACLLSDGRVFAWGSFRDSHGNMGLTLNGNQRRPVEVLPNIKCCQIASGADHLVVLTTVGKVYTMGCAEQGQLGRVTLRSASGESRRGKTQLLQPEVVHFRSRKLTERIWATTYCTFRKEFNGDSIFAFGLNNYCQLALGKAQKKKDMPIVCPTLTKLENVKKISGGQHHTLVLTKDNKCYAIGRRDYGRLGLGELKADVEDLTLVKALEDKEIVDISCGECQSFAVTAEGQVYAWGMGSNLQLGTGQEDDEIEPVAIVSNQTRDKKILKVVSGGQHTLFLVAEGNSTAVAPKPAKKEVNAKASKEKEDIAKVEEVQVNGAVDGPINMAADSTVEEQAQIADQRKPTKGKRRKN